MFGGDDDPFGAFSHMHQHMRQMDRMMESMMDPFGMMGMPTGRNMIENNRRQQHPAYEQQQMQMASPFSPFGGLMGMGMGGFGGIFSAMNQLQNQAMNDPNAHVYSQSTMMTFGEDGQPRVVKNTVNRRGDVREERREVRDAEQQSMSIGHSIGDRTHIIEKKRDKDGNVRRQQRFVNLDESAAHDFDREFQTRVRSTPSYGGTARPWQHSLGNGDNYDRTGASGSNHSGVSYRDGSSVNAPIITLPEEDDHPRRSRAPGSTYSSSSSRSGPVIREISDEEAESSISKKRRDGHHFHHGD